MLLCSDTHLLDEQPDLTQIFLDWLKVHAYGADWLLLLGDIFEAWVGDDLIHAQTTQDTAQTPPVWQGLAQTLQAVRARRPGRPLQVGLMAGNRDFLMGEGLCNALGAQLLDENVLLQHPGLTEGPVLVCHGDALCTADAAYQAWRSLSRGSQWQGTFLAKPIAERLAIARTLREQSEKEKTDKPAAWMDVVPEVADHLLTASGANLLIHGHTHLPGCYVLPSGRSRWVLPDWSSTRGGGLMIDHAGIVVVPR